MPTNSSWLHICSRFLLLKKASLRTGSDSEHKSVFKKRQPSTRCVCCRSLVALASLVSAHNYCRMYLLISDVPIGEYVC